MFDFNIENMKEISNQIKILYNFKSFDIYIKKKKNK